MDSETYTVTVDSTAITTPVVDINGTITNSYWWDGYTNYPYTGWTYYPQTIYKYQIICPRCKTSNWLELDTIVACAGKKCNAKLKAVTQQADYEIPVTVAAAA
jgi:hypothetical protein